MPRSLANAALLLAAAIWGGAFVVQKAGAAHLGPMTFTGVRFLIGALIVLPFALRAWRTVRLGRTEWLGMLATGGALFAGAVLQQIGINGTTATNAGFLTTLYVPLVPLLVFAAVRTVPHPVVWPAGIGCVLGTWLLSGGGAVTLGAGDAWVVVSAFFWAVQVSLVGTMAERTGAPTVVAFVQFLMCGVLSTLWGAAAESTTVAELADAGLAIAYTGVLSVGVAFTLQVVGQRWTSAASAAVILSSEAVFAALAGMVALGETLNAPQLLGCAIILGSILAVQLLPSWQESRAAA